MERTPDVVTFTFETTVDYVVNLATGEVARKDDGEIADEYHYVALFCEGEFAGEYHLCEGKDPEDEALIKRAEKMMEDAMQAGTVVGDTAPENEVTT